MPDPIKPDTKQATTTPDTGADPIKGGLLHRLLGMVKPEDAKPVIPPDDTVDAQKAEAERLRLEAETAAKAATPADKKIKLVKRTGTPATKDDIADLVRDKKPEPASTASATPAVIPPEDNLDGLLDEEKDEVSLAKYAETKDDKFKGLGTKFADFFKANKAELEKRAAADTDFNPAEDSEYQAWVKAQRPRLTRSERDKLFAQKVKDDTVAELQTKHQAELDEIRREVKGTKVGPEIDRRSAEVEAAIYEGLPADALAFYKANDGDLEKTAADFGLEVEVARAAAAGAKKVAAEFFAVREGVRPFDAAANPIHRFISDFILSESDQFAKAGGDALVRDGKTFVTPDKYTKESAATSWTFTDDDIIDRLKLAAHKEIGSVIIAREAAAKASGFVRGPKSAPKETVMPPPNKPAPKATPSRSAGPLGNETPSKETALHRLLKVKAPA